MTEAETILKMIETVDPADTTKLDEIDARVWCSVASYDFKRILKRTRTQGFRLLLILS